MDTRRKAFASLLPLGLLAVTRDRAVAAQNTNSLTTFVSSANFVGTITVTAVQQVNGILTAVGTIAGTGGGQTGAGTFTAPLAVSGSCTILTLTLGPLNLNLLGLVITIPNPIVLTITAVPGAGNLLGNLLCAVANLLNGGLSLNTLLAQLVDALNRIIAAL